MIHVILHWLNTELWGPMWPNIFSPSFWTLLGIAVADYRNHRRTQNHHDRLEDLTGQVNALSARLMSLIGGHDDNK